VNRRSSRWRISRGPKATKLSEQRITRRLWRTIPGQALKATQLLEPAFYISQGDYSMFSWHLIKTSCHHLALIPFPFTVCLFKCLSIILMKNKRLVLFRAFHYRSLSITPTVAAYNNRAQAEIKLKHWHKAMSDCGKVLELEPGNMKGALLFFFVQSRFNCSYKNARQQKLDNNAGDEK